MNLKYQTENLKIHDQHLIKKSFKSIKDQFSYVQLILEGSNTQFFEVFDSLNKFFRPLNFIHLFLQKKLWVS